MSGRRTRILYLSNLFYAEPWNGIMEHTRLLIDGLDPERYEPIVAVRPDDGTQTRTLAERTDARTCSLTTSRGIGEVRDLCRAEMIDVVHIQTPVTGGIPRLAVGARVGGVRLILVTYHLVQGRRPPLRSRVINRVTHRLLIDRTIAVSSGVAASLAEHAGLDRRRIEVVYNGAAPYDANGPSLAPAPTRSGDEVRIGYVGRLAKEKGVSYLLEALALLKRRCPRTRTILVGDGYERHSLEAQGQRLALGETVVFAGHRADARALMREVDVIVLPSLLEGLPYVLVEAMDAGRPVVATRIPGSSEVVEDGVSGLLVPPADPQALAGALATLIEDPSMRARMGAGGRRRFLQYFDSRRMVERIQGMYDEALGSRPGQYDRVRGSHAAPRSA